MSEFSLIEDIRALFESIPKNNFEGIGDDCAVLPIGNNEALLFTSDMLNEGIHFLPERVSAHDIGYKAVMVNISDIAAMGATPVATLLSIALPKRYGEEWAKGFIEGYRKASAEFGVTLVGGDTTASASDIIISVTAIGRAPMQNIKRRNGAKVGDTILVGGVLGGSAAGLRDILRGECDTANALTHRLPQAQVREGELLGSESKVHAMMDISDGIASDLRHILKASGVGAIVDLERMPTCSTIEDALCGGEEYKLLLTVASDAEKEIIERCYTATGTLLCAIGTITEGNDIEWRRNGERIDVEYRGYEHF